MITIITEDECLYYNFGDVIKEKKFISLYEYHKINKTGKLLKVRYENDVIEFNPQLIISVEYENRRYDPVVGNEIERLIKNL